MRSTYTPTTYSSHRPRQASGGRHDARDMSRAFDSFDAASAAVLSGKDAMLRYVFAGKAVFSLYSSKTGAHRTYNVTLSKDKERHYVKVRLGSSFVFLGTMFDKTKVHPGKKTTFTRESPEVVALNWFLSVLASSSAFPESFSFVHSGTCARCSRRLTDPESVRTGLGPECRTKPLN